MQQQRGVVRMDICLRLMRNYKIKSQGNRQTNTIRRTTTKTRPTTNIEMDKTKRNTTGMARTRQRNNNVEKLKTIIRQGLTRRYPINKQDENILPHWAQKAQQWCTPKEWEAFQKHLKGRQKLQKTITELDRQEKKQLKNITMRQIMNAWQQAAKYAKKTQAPNHIRNKKLQRKTKTPKKTPETKHRHKRIRRQ